MVTPHFAYLFMIWWMFRCFHSSATVSHAAWGIHEDIFVEISVFSYLGFIPRSGIARSHNSIFKFLRKCQFSKAVALIPVSIGRVRRGFQPFQVLTKSLWPWWRFHLRPSQRTWGGHHTALLSCVAPTTNDAEHFGSCAFWPTVYLFLEKWLFQFFAHFKTGLFTFLLLSFKNNLYILRTRSLSDKWFPHIFSHFVGCFSAFLNSILLLTKAFKSNLSISLPSVPCALSVLTHAHCTSIKWMNATLGELLILPWATISWLLLINVNYYL